MLKTKFKRWKQLSKQSCKAIVQLMENGFSLMESMKIIEEKDNKEVLDSIFLRLQKGEDIKTFFHLYCPKEYCDYFACFILYMPFLDAFTTTIRIEEQEEKNRKQILTGMLYPSILLIGVIVGIYMFNIWIMPNMITLMKSFQSDVTFYTTMHDVLHVVSILFLLICTVCCIIVFVCLQKQHVVSTYCFIAKYFPNAIVIQHVSEQFARFFLECQKRNDSTKLTLSILKQLQSKPCVVFIAKQMDLYLNAGERLELAIEKANVEKTLLRFFRIALYASDCVGMLEGYLKMVEIRKQRAIRTYTRYVQCFSYSCIGVVLVFVYQILMIPMTMLQNM